MRFFLACLLFMLSAYVYALPVSSRPLSGSETIVAMPADGFVEISSAFVMKDKAGCFVFCSQIVDQTKFSGKKSCERFVSAAGYVRLRTKNPEAVYVAMGLRRKGYQDHIVLFYRIP